MAASSAKDKAQSLKDSYVAGLLDGAATDAASAMPTQDMGEQASMHIDVNRGRATFKNDGDARIRMYGPRGTIQMNEDHSAGLNQVLIKELTGENRSKQFASDLVGMPYPKKNYGHQDSGPLTDEQRKDFSTVYHGLKNKGIY